MSPSSCAAVRRDLAWFVGDDLARDRAREVAAHLAGCPPCRREASSLQQAHKALASLREVAPAAADAAMFESLQRETLATVEREVALAGERRPGPAVLVRLLWSAAAVLLFGLGWWSVRQPEAPSLLDRAPIPIAAADRAAGPTALPWAGPRARLVPLGYDEGAGARQAGSTLGSGMMTRLRLRTLEDEILDPTGR